MTDVLSVNQVYAVTGASPTVIRQWIAQDKLKATKIEGRWMVNLSDLVEFAEKRNNMAKGNAKHKELKENENCIRR